MPMVRSTVSHALATFMEEEAVRCGGTVSDLIRMRFMQDFRSHTTVVERQVKAQQPARPVGRPPKRKPPKQGPPPPGVTVSMEPGVEHTIMWQRGGPQVWDAYDENFYRWLDENYPYDPETESRPNPPEVTEADIERFWAS